MVGKYLHAIDKLLRNNRIGIYIFFSLYGDENVVEICNSVCMLYFEIENYSLFT